MVKVGPFKRVRFIMERGSIPRVALSFLKGQTVRVTSLQKFASLRLKLRTTLKLTHLSHPYSIRQGYEELELL